MLNLLSPAPPDGILALINLFREDTRPEKIDLGVGVYKDDNGNTPIFDSVKSAEKWILETEETKSYVGMRGNIGFDAAMLDLLVGEAVNNRMHAIQAPGGCGALRLLAELIARAQTGATIWVSDPTWPNHVPIMKSAGLNIEVYPYFDAQSGEVRFDAMADKLRELGSKDVVLLHACCHNPTGANLTPEQWDEIATIAEEKGWLPFFDIAYQGFGDGLLEDSYSIRCFAQKVPQMLVAASCSKNFGLYRERVGCAIVMAENAEKAEISAGNIMNIARGNYSMPPNHGAAIVEYIMNNAEARNSWQQELEVMRVRMLASRALFSQAMAERLSNERFDFIARHRGMFSLLGLSDEQVIKLREEHAVYLVGGGGRINVAGLVEKHIPRFADAISAVL